MQEALLRQSRWVGLTERYGAIFHFSYVSGCVSRIEPIVDIASRRREISQPTIWCSESLSTLMLWNDVFRLIPMWGGVREARGDGEKTWPSYFLFSASVRRHLGLATEDLESKYHVYVSSFRYECHSCWTRSGKMEPQRVCTTDLPGHDVQARTSGATESEWRPNAL